MRNLAVDAISVLIDINLVMNKILTKIANYII